MAKEQHSCFLLIGACRALLQPCHVTQDICINLP